MKRYYILLVMSVLALVILSCSGSSSTPVAPDTESTLDLTGGREAQSNQPAAHLWGLWEVHIDPDNESIEVVPLRGVAFTCNVVRFIDGPPSFLILDIVSVDIQPGHMDFVLDVGLQHPFPGLDRYTGFDVLGVFMGDGTDVYPGPDAFPVAGANDQQMLNSDGYTRWFNAPEFTGAGMTMPLFGFIPGKYGTPQYLPSAELNPYKYFADGLEKYNNAFVFLVNNSDDRGCFKPGSVNRRIYDLRFPNVAGTRFQYAVIAHWEPNDGFPEPPDDLDDFPITANADESAVVDVVDDSTLYYVDGISGGEMILDISPWDWSAECNGSGVIEEYAIKCYSSAWTGEYALDMTPVAQGDHYCTFHAEIPVETLDSNDPLPIWIEVDYPDLDYTNYLGIENEADGALSGYFRFDVPVANEIPPWIEVITPNGDEEWVVGAEQEIVWDSWDVPGTVFIDYSKDGFVDDINSIAIAEPNDGSFLWEIPDDPSETVRVRVSSTDDPTVFDISDEDFSILLPWIEVIIPNGGEEWVVGTKQKIVWAPGYVPGTVFIEYSKDGFVDDINSIAIDEPNFGHSKWEIPDDPSDTVRVRVSSTDDPGVFDISDDNFSIVSVFGWARTWGAGNDDYGRGTAIDTSGNVYVTGMFSKTVDFDPGPGIENRTPTGVHDHSDDAYLSKFDALGNFQWVLTWGGPARGDSGIAVAVDTSGNIYVVGRFTETTDFDPGEGIDEHTWNGGDADIFISKFDPSGGYQWAVTWGGTGHDIGAGIAVDGSDNVYVTGYYNDDLDQHYTVDFDPGPGIDNHTSNGYADCFLSRFDSSGNLQWARTWGGTYNDKANRVAVDDLSNVYVTGWFNDTVDFDPGDGTEEHSPIGQTDAFLSRFDSSGTFHWARTWGGLSHDLGYEVAATGSGNIYVTGYFHDTVDFNPGAGTDNHSSIGDSDIYLSGFDSSGTFQWAHTWGSTEHEMAQGVAIDTSGYIYTTGLFNETVDFDPGTGTDNHTTNGSSDFYVSKFDSSGIFQWARTWGGPGQEYGAELAVGPSENIYVTGSFMDTVDFDPGPGLDEHTSNGDRDVFLMKLLPDGYW